jgi:hypothetical protein
VVGQNCITIDQGQIVYDAIHPELKAGRSIELDFDQVRIFASPFFNAAVGRLLQDIAAADLNRLLRVEHLSPAGLDVLRHVIENSKQYYSNPAERHALDKILSDHTSE